MRKYTTALLAAAAVVAAPLTVAPIAAADICAGAHGRFVGVEGCGAPIAHIATGAAIAGGVAVAAADHPYIDGEIPCYTVEGVPYYTPPGQPC